MPEDGFGDPLKKDVVVHNTPYTQLLVRPSGFLTGGLSLVDSDEHVLHLFCDPRSPE
jgi:hypothetical protein